MSPLVLVVFVLLVVILVFVLSAIRLADLADDRRDRIPLPTARQRRKWRRERLDLNPAMRRRS